MSTALRHRPAACPAAGGGGLPGLALLLLGTLLWAAPSGADWELASAAIGGGSVSASSDGEHLLSATVGQAVAASAGDGTRSLAGGFWPVALATAAAEGAVTCTLFPEAVRAQGAQWRLTSGPDTGWRDSGAVVVAVPVAGNPYAVTFRAVEGWTSPPDQTLAVVGHDTTAIEGTYALRTYTVTFLAEPNGSLDGATVQTVAHGADTSPVTAVPAYAFVFAGWDSGSGLNPLSLTNVTASQTLTASFRAANPVAPAGAFLAVVGADGPAARKGLWDLTGPYATAVKGATLAMDLVHDTKGKVTGSASYTTAKAVVVTAPVKGNAKGSGSTLPVKLTVKGASPDRALGLALTLVLTLDAGARALVGTMAGSVTANGAATQVSTEVVLAVPPPMDGTWNLRLALVPGPKVATGTARLTLSNGAHHDYLAKGKPAGEAVALSLAADPADPAAKGIRIKAPALPLEGGWAALQSCSLKGYGQTLFW
jgi:hypothetical protein